MKKILYITRQELCQQLNVDEIVICKKKPQPLSELGNKIIDYLAIALDRPIFKENQIVPPDKKIAAIKALREYAYSINASMGLAEAKYAIENLSEFMKFVNDNNRLPAFTSYSDTFRMY